MGFGIADLEAEDKLTPELDAKFEDVFKKFDKDKNGRIDINELKSALEASGFTFSTTGLATIMSLSDLDGTKTLPKVEFKFLLGRFGTQREHFRSIDKSGAGKIDKSNIDELLKKNEYAFTPKQVSMIYPLVDRDNNGTIEESEWLVFATFLRFCKLQFIIADKNSDGKLSFEETAKHLPRLGLPEWPEATVRKIFNVVDVDKNGTLSFEEFAVLVGLAKLQNK